MITKLTNNIVDNKYERLSLQLVLFFALYLFSSLSGDAQTLSGTIIDLKTKEVLPFVHVGVINKNIGVISDDKGHFVIDLSSVTNQEQVVFSMIGYETFFLPKGEIKSDQMRIVLTPKEYQLEEIVVKPIDVIETIKLGRVKPSKTTTGQSGLEKFGYGGEWGIQIKHEGKNYLLEDVNFHTRFNTVDSVLFRINIYPVVDELPGESILNNQLYVTSYAKDKWISKNILSENIIINDDIIVTFELVQIWYSEKGENQLFYTHGKGYAEGKSYSRDTSFDQWKINERGPIAMYVTGRVLP